MKKYTGFSKAGVIVGVIVIILIAIAGFLVIDGNNRATDYSKYDFNSIIAADEHNGNIGDHVKGNPSAPVIIYEYADFQCPGCASMNPRINAILEEAGDDLGLVYRNYLLNYHQNGTAAASAAEAAGLQGYWKPYADKLFASQAEWEYASGSERTALFNQYFTEVTNGNGDLEKFQNDISSREVKQKISFDMGIGSRIDIPATPALYVDNQYIDWSNKSGSEITVNGKKLSWDHSLTSDELKKLIFDIIDAKKSN